MRYSVVESFNIKTPQGNIITLPTGRILNLTEEQAEALGGKIRLADKPAPPPPTDWRPEFKIWVTESGELRSRGVSDDLAGEIIALTADIQEAEKYERNKQYRQETRLLVLVEAAGMLPQIVKAVGVYGVPVFSSSGFDSLTMKYELAMDIVDDGRPTVVFHIGDLDPSGVCIFDSVKADVEAFVGEQQVLLFERVALIPEHVAQYSLETAPAKETDRRGNGVTETCQCEALPPDTLAEIVKSAVLEYIDQAQFKSDQTEELQERQYLVDKLQNLKFAT